MVDAPKKAWVKTRSCQCKPYKGYVCPSCREQDAHIAALKVQLAELEAALSRTGAVKATYPSASATEVDPDGAFERAYAEVTGVQLTEPTPPEATPPASKLAERGKTEREIECDVYSKIRLAFRRALSELPEIAPLEISRVLSSVHMRDEFINEGKRLQRAHGTDAVAPRVEQECGAGAWSFIRKGILSALEATPPAPKVTECATEGCAQAATVRFERGGVGSDYCHDCYMRIQVLTAAQGVED